MKFRAPGKIVISGAYAVLEGAPAIVSAVNRDAIASDERAADFVSDEVRLAVERGVLTVAPWSDASALRTGDRKLGLGSSAAVLVAALALACWPRAGGNEESFRQELFRMALELHRAAQGGGSGVDVAASVFGGCLSFRLDPQGTPQLRSTRLPDGLHIEVWASPQAASTRHFVGQVQAAAKRQPRLHTAILQRQAEASTLAEQACTNNDADGLLEALRAQCEALLALGELARIPIYTPEVLELDALAQTQGAAVIPAGAGGGDVSLFVGRQPAWEGISSQRARLGLEDLELRLAARGVSPAA